VGITLSVFTSEFYAESCIFTRLFWNNAKIIRRGSFTSTADLKDKLTRFIASFNEVFAKPFRWTFTGRPLQTGEQKKTSKRRQRFQRINDLRY